MLLAADRDAGSTSAWRQALGDADPGLLDRRLAWAADGPSIDGPFAVRRGGLEALRTTLRASVDLPLREPADDAKPFDDLWWPVAAASVRQLRGLVEPGLGFVVAESAWNDLSRALVAQLCEVTTPTLWSLFQRDRGLGTALVARLAARDAPACRERNVFRTFIRNRREDGLESVFAEFPVLGRHLDTVLSAWHESQAEMLQRLAADRAALSAPPWQLPPAWPLVSVHCGLSDPHRGGRTVAVLGFSNAEECATLVYKPKDLRLDAAFQSLVADLNRDAADPLQTVDVLVRAHHGYMSHVEHTFCRDEAELHRFYRNAGRLTALLYLLGCTDCHAENLIACGDSLVLVDAETLLEGVVPHHSRGAGEGQTALPETGLQRLLSDSVLRVGVLPTWRFMGPEKMPLDMSALGSDVPARSHCTRHGWQWLNSDAMTLGPVECAPEVPNSLPVGTGQPHALPRHRNALMAGFREQAMLLMARRPEWLSAGGPLARMAGLPRRLVVRNTSVYGAMREQQLRPEALVSEGAQQLVLEQLARTFLVTEECPQHWPLFASECEQLSQLDFPFFEHATDGRDLVSGSDRMVVPDFLETTGLAATRVRLEKLDDDAIAFQLRLVQGALDARWEPSTRGPSPAPALSEPAEPSRLRSGRDRADELLRRLQWQAFEDTQGSRDWLGLALGADSRSFCFGAVGHSLYGGNFGVALLQAGLGKRQERDGVLRPLLALAARADASALRRWWSAQPLGLNGAGGTLLGLQALDRLGAEPPAGWDSHGAVVVRLLQGLTEDRIRADGQLDVMGGVAGLIGALFGAGLPRSRALAVLAGEHLLDRQLRNGGWPQPSATLQSLALTGFAHGTAGFAACLCELHRRTGESRFLDGARRALAYERQGFDPGLRNWPYRPTVRSAPASMTAWCHGAPGVALGRLCLRDTPLWDDAAAAETSIALATTAAAMPACDHLCCGAFGLVAVLRAAGARLQEPAWPAAAEAMARLAIERAKALQDDLPTGAPGRESFLQPGLFTGASGIGLALLESPAAEDCIGQLLSAGCLPGRDPEASA